MAIFSTSGRLTAKALMTVVVKGTLTTVVSCAPGATGSPAATSGAHASGIAWRNCGKRLQCAQVAVPLNWTRPRGKHIGLAVIRYLASRSAHLIGSMFVNPGGPGQSGVDLVRREGAQLAAWGGGRFDVVSWDPRGTNASDPVRCFTDKASEARFWRGVRIPVTPAESRAYANKTLVLASRCGQVSGPLLDNISTEDSVRDLDYLRQPIGDKTLTYVGLSYGSLIGQIYENMYPARVRAMMHVRGPIEAWWLWAPCASNWPGHATERYAGPWNAKTKTPILLIDNVYDPATSYSGAKHAERLLGNAVLLTVASYGHPSFQLPSRCVDSWRVRYLVDLVARPNGTVCVAGQSPFQPPASQRH